MSNIRKSARGEECQLRIPGVCNHNPETTVWAHANGLAAGKGMGMKSPDILGAYACSACHDVYDRRTPLPSHLRRDQINIAFYEGHQRSLLKLIEQGLVKCV